LPGGSRRWSAGSASTAPPIDLTNPADARWLLACVWPDTGRLERTAASIRLAREDLPPVIAGDAVEDLPGMLAALADGAPAVVVTTWAFAYLGVEERRAFVQVLEEASQVRPLAWLSAEGAGTVEAFAGVRLPEHDSTSANILGVLLFEGGTTSEHLLGFVHQHGNWIDWREVPV